jgi:hypothetical protein
MKYFLKTKEPAGLWASWYYGGPEKRAQITREFLCKGKPLVEKFKLSNHRDVWRAVPENEFWERLRWHTERKLLFQIKWGLHEPQGGEVEPAIVLDPPPTF